MTARKCFTRKIAAGVVSARAGRALLDTMDAWERDARARTGDDATGLRRAAAGAVETASAEAARKADLVYRSVVAQANVLRAFKGYSDRLGELRSTTGFLSFGNKAPPFLGKETQTPLGAAMRSLLARDPWEIASWGNVHYLARDIRGRAHSMFAEAIEYLRPKMIGLKAEATRELDVLRALFGKTDVDAGARASAEAFTKVAEDLRTQFVEAGGALPARKNWRLPNPDFDATKVRALGEEKFKALVRDNVDRGDMVDFNTGKPMADRRFEDLLDQAFKRISNDRFDEAPSAAGRGSPMLANSRDVTRLFSWKDAEAWQRVSEAVGTHHSPFHTMVAHIAGMADDIAMMRILGPNPDATKRFIHDLFDREAARLSVEAPSAEPGALASATRTNRRVEARVRTERRMFDDLYGEVSGANRIPVNMEMARTISDVRGFLSSTQLGSAIVSAISHLGALTATMRWNRMSPLNVVSRAIAMAGEKGSEIFAAQQGLIADTLAHVMGETDKMMGETIRMGVGQKLASANIRASGLRRWTAVLRAAFGLEMMAQVARERGKAFAELDPKFREALGRYAIGEAEWKTISSAIPHEPRENASFTRPMDVAELGTPAARDASEKLARLIHTEMDYAVYETDPIARSIMVGDTRPGTISGELRRGMAMYRLFPSSVITYHFARALARGWDGSRLAHGAITFLGMTTFGLLAYQLKELSKGRDPLPMDPSLNGLRTWGHAMLQGGGLGVFGDMLNTDKTRYDNSWASIVMGPIGSLGEDVLGKWLIKNIQLSLKGKPTNFAGDAVYTAARYVPGSSLWYARLAFDRAIVDQVARMADPKAPERFARMEQQARKDFGQSYWWRPGQAAPARSPDLATAAGR